MTSSATQLLAATASCWSKAPPGWQKPRCSPEDSKPRRVLGATVLLIDFQHFGEEAFESSGQTAVAQIAELIA